ncbi:MAG: acetyl-CoA carboxylase carboxyltransferase subunit beta [Sedimentisphaerales bacterium]|nr:acetyl-CoA carboxylase carboxyltransferase subunit beta [Sedimentisphaerales bacterium]
MSTMKKMAKQSKSQWDGYSLKPRKEMPEGLWLKCPGCAKTIFQKAVAENMHVCPECGHHFRIGAKERIQYLVDEGSFEQILSELVTSDPLDFKFRDTSYKERAKSAEKGAAGKEAMLAGKAFIKGRGIMLAVMDFNYLGGSMGAVVGEKLSTTIEKAMEDSLPLVVISSSGGARMHEGVLSLGQMAKTSAALAKFDDNGGLFISILTDPTTGGVTASFAMLGDVIIAEPGALIGFAGPRTIYETIKVELPEGFQRAEFLLEHGFIDMIVKRKDLRSEIARLIDYCGKH